MEYRLIMRILESNTDISCEELQKKVDILYLGKKLTDAEYFEITSRIMCLKGGE